MTTFANRLIYWQMQHGRHDLPWQCSEPYRVWLSEIMLQQTQVNTVIPYYQRFVASFPTIAALAAATEEQVLTHWSGLGYYARGRNLHKAAQLIVEQHGGEFPRAYDDVLALPGIGRSTAAAICALALQQKRAIRDGNVKRVLARFCGVEGWAGNKQIENTLWQHAEALLPARDIAIYTQALMDMGATVCTRSRPKCALCPVQKDCVALATDRVTTLPTARPRKSVPERKATLLLVMHGNHVLLEKRSGAGIWGGLWCPPQVEDVHSERAYLRQQGLATNDRIELTAFTHVFTHFRLNIQPVLQRVAERPLRAAETGESWMTLADALQAAIPTPVRRVLRELQVQKV